MSGCSPSFSTPSVRRAGVMTDVEFAEIRYAGNPCISRGFGRCTWHSHHCIISLGNWRW